MNAETRLLSGVVSQIKNVINEPLAAIFEQLETLSGKASASEADDDNSDFEKLCQLASQLGNAYSDNQQKISNAFFSALDTNLYESSTRISKKLNALDSFELSLVEHDDLELQIILTHTAASLLSQFQTDLTLLCMRFEHLATRTLSVSKTALGPVTLGQAYLDAIQPLELDIDVKKQLLMALLLSLKMHYKQILDDANSTFVKNNVLADLSEDDIAVKQKEEEAKKEAQDQRNELLGIDDSEGVIVSEEIAKFLEEIEIPEDAEQHILKGDASGPAISRAEITSKIDLIRSTPTTEDNGVYLQPSQSSQSLVESLIEEAGLDKYNVDEHASKTMGIMSLTFERLLDNEQIPPPIKGLLEQLQIPLLKAAVQDVEFFGDIENSAQQLFNNIMEASLRWSPEQDPERDALYKKMSAIAEKVNTDFEDDYLIFDDAILDFENFNEQEEQKANRFESRVVDKENAQARIQLAQQVSDEHIQTLITQTPVRSIKNFFQTTWRQALFFTFNQSNSIEAEEWLDALELEESIIANQQNAQEEDIEILMDILADKLEECGIQEHEITTQVKQVESALIKSNLGEIEDTSEDIASAINEPVSEETTAETKSRELAPEPDVTSAPADTPSTDAIQEEEAEEELSEEAEDILADIHVGTWLQKNTEPAIKIKVAAHIKFNDTYVMVLRNGAKENTYSRKELIEQILAGTLTVMKNDLLFDSALESVIGDIR